MSDDFPSSFPVFFDRQGRRIVGMLEYARLLDDPDYQRVAFDVVGGLRVSTVWIGVDAGAMYRNGPPIIFETLVFDDDAPAGELSVPFGQRYCTEAEALVGHAAALAWARSETRVFDALGGIVAVAVAQQRLGGT